MYLIIIFAMFGIVSLVWLLAEPISGVFGSTILAKLFAVILVWKAVSATVCWLVGSGIKKITL